MPELRIDLIGGRRVYVAEDRAGRPNDFAAAASTDCPFCAGNEAATPHELAAVRDEQGDWQVRVVPNKFPAVMLEAEAPSPGHSEVFRGVRPDPSEDLGVTGASLTLEPAFGAHEVIIESPRHLREVTELSVAQFAAVLGVYRDRLRCWAADGRMAHGLVFKNSGHAAGASLQHVHSQLVALPYAPEAVQRELDAAAEFFARGGGCIFCDLLAREFAEGSRLVRREGGFAALAAYAGRQPLEMWVAPERHAARFDELADAELPKLAAVLHGALRALEAVAPGAAYNLMLHSGPFGPAAADHYHWHWEIVPRVAQLAGFELGSGAYINAVSPEHAAQRLRDAWR